jgi:hypothetical protein
MILEQVSWHINYVKYKGQLIYKAKPLVILNKDFQKAVNPTQSELQSDNQLNAASTHPPGEC